MATDTSPFGGPCSAVNADAETRVALIIGNSAYQKSEMRLPNPANDAAAMAKALLNWI